MNLVKFGFCTLLLLILFWLFVQAVVSKCFLYSQFSLWNSEALSLDPVT